MAGGLAPPQAARESGGPPSTWSSTSSPPLRCPGLEARSPCSSCSPSPPLDWVTYHPRPLHILHSPLTPSAHLTPPHTPPQAPTPPISPTAPAVRGRLSVVSTTTWSASTQRELRNLAARMDAHTKSMVWRTYLARRVPRIKYSALLTEIKRPPALHLAPLTPHHQPQHWHHVQLHQIQLYLTPVSPTSLTMR